VVGCSELRRLANVALGVRLCQVLLWAVVLCGPYDTRKYFVDDTRKYFVVPTIQENQHFMLCGV
jgi:hypothetical protein